MRPKYDFNFVSLISKILYLCKTNWEMRCKLVKVNKLSGNKASVYSVIIDDEQLTLLDKFIQENKNSYLSELKNIVGRLRTIGKTTGARMDYFKLNEGVPGDGVCALYDEPDNHLRLYCIRYGTQIIVLGSGGPKPKSIRGFQDNDKLTEENYFLRWLSVEITKRIKDRDIEYSKDYLNLLGNLEFDDNEK